MDRYTIRRRVSRHVSGHAIQRAVVEALEARRLLAHFAVIGDFSSDNQAAPTRDVANLVKSWNPDFVATVGDNNYPDGASSTIDSNVGQWYHQFISPYTGSYGGGASTNRFFPAIGNHDYSSSGGYSPYLNYFSLPGNERYYSTVQGNVQVFVLNSDSHEPDGTSSTSTQGKWLQSALASSTAQWKIVLFHHPAYSSGSLGSNSFMQWPFQSWGASAVISGHDHDYERIIKNGFPYFVSGLGGESIVGFGSTVSGSAVRYNNDYGAMLIDTSSTAMTFQFVNRSGQVIDNYSIGSTSTTAPSSPTGLAVSAQASTQAKLTWTDSSPGVTSSFKLERSSDGGANFSVIANTLAGVTTYLDQGLAPGGTYVYRVRASNSAGDSAPSSTKSVTLPTGSTTFVSDMTWASSTNGWGPVERDKSVGGSNAGDGNALTLNGVTYTKGLGAHAASSIVLNLNKQYSTFLSDIGVDDETGPGTVVFQVLADGVQVYSSGTMTQAGATGSVTLDVSNVTQLTLVVTDSGDGTSYDHADWANARLQAPTASQPPAAPASLVASAVSPTQINLRWSDVINENGFRVERSIDNVTFAAIGSVGASVVSYSDTTVSGSTRYYYRVIATSASGDSPPSNVDFARPMQIPSDPSNLVATAASAGQINLTWLSNNTDEEMSFKIERSLDGVNNWTPIATIPETEAYSDTTAQASTTYYYRVRGTNLAGDSGNSNVASATTPAVVAGPITYITTGSTWKYLDTGTNQGTAWRAAGFDDSTWKSGLAQLGYGDGDEATVVGYGTNASSKFITTYFRKSFAVSDPSQVSGLTLRILRDDGAVVYVNGTEVYRTNMPTGTISSGTPASSSVEDNTYFSTTFSNALLVAGTNVIAVEIHQSDTASSDISFDFELKGTIAGPPTAPAAPGSLGANPVSATQINLTWVDSSGNETGFILERSTDNITFTQIATPAANATSYSDSTGLAASTKYYYRIRATNAVGPSGNSNVANATTLAVSTFPSPWVDGDIGTTGASGSATYSAGVFMMKGAGTDIWGTADSFNFVYQPWTGDGQIIARVTSVQNTNSGAHAGVMFRGSLAANAQEASVVLTATNGIGFVRRTTAGGTSTVSTATAAMPYWLKLIRAGNSFTAYRSTNGTTWTQVGSAVTISMGSTIYVGLVACSKVPGTLGNATIDGVSTSTSTSSTRAGSVAAAQAAALTPATFSATVIAADTPTTTKKNDVLDLLA